MRLLISIRPEYANAIFLGEKLYEYRRRIFKRSDVDTVVVYATKPVGKVIGEFTIETIITDMPSALWSKTSEGSGISSDYFFSYFSGVQVGHAIKIGDTIKYHGDGIDISDLGVARPPQSYMYIE